MMISIMMRPKELWAILLALATWQVLALLVDNVLFLPSPILVAQTLVRLLSLPETYSILAGSFVRIGLGFFLSLILGLLSASLAIYRPVIADLIAPYVAVCKSVPVASLVLLALLWLGSAQLPTFIVFLVCWPIIHTNVYEGMRAADPKLLELAQVYRFSFLAKLKYIYFPEAYPTLVSALSLTASVAWKSGIAAEIIAVSTHSTGAAITQAKSYLDSPEMFAWTSLILILSALFTSAVRHIQVYIKRRWEE